MVTILYIDDEPLVLELYRILLEREGYKVLTAPDGLTGIALTRNHVVDLVVLDFRMPGMNGNQVAEVLRQEHPILPIVIWSGCPEEIFGSSADALLNKGDGPEALISTIKTIMKGSAMREDNPSERMSQKARAPATKSFGAG